MKSIHGGDIYNNKVNMDFSVNINPLGIPHSVKEAMSDALSYADRYPDMACSGLKKAISEYFTQQLVVIGTGDPQYENMFRHYAWKYPDRVSANICYSDDLAHKLYAAADAFLMPSRFEPCGLTQLISFRYGTVPIVRETGGLKDTVKPYNEYENSGDGFSFSNYNADEMLAVINYSKHIFFDKKREWNQIVDRGMANDFSWNASKFKYEGLYNYLIGE